MIEIANDLTSERRTSHSIGDDRKDSEADEILHKSLLVGGRIVQTQLRAAAGHNSMRPAEALSEQR
jgi:hypothetical protein